MFYILLGIILGIFVYYKIIKSSKYWEKRNIVHEPSRPIIGNMWSSITHKKHLVEITADIYRKYPGERYVGYMQFNRPLLLLRDPDLIKQIAVEDFDNFSFASTNQDPLSKSLVGISEENWKQMRTKEMYHLMTECAANFAAHFKGKEPVAVEMKDIFTRFATDVIATTAFGIQVNSLKQSNNFFRMGMRLSGFNVVMFFKLALLHISRTLSEVLGLPLFPKDVTNFFKSVIKDNITKREKEAVGRQDLINMIMKIRKGENGKKMELTDVAQALLFVFTEFDMASRTSGFMAHELAVNPDIQEKLHEEIDTINEKYKGKIPCETILSMKYLDQIVCETLRLWPPGYQTETLCTEDYHITPKNPGDRTVLIEKGVLVLIPVLSLHRDPRYYQEPDRFDPERFNDENKVKIVPGTYLPFGLGRENCIGSRIATLQIKTLFFHLLSKFDIVPINDTQIPLEISLKKIHLAPEKGFRLGFKPRKTFFIN